MVTDMGIDTTIFVHLRPNQIPEYEEMQLDLWNFAMVHGAMSVFDVCHLEIFLFILFKKS